MIRVIVLDASPLGLLSSPRKTAEVLAGHLSQFIAAEEWKNIRVP